MDYQVFCIIVFTLDEIQLLAAQPRLDLLGRGEVKGWRKEKEWGKGERAVWKQLFWLLLLLSCFVFCSISPLDYF